MFITSTFVFVIETFTCCAWWAADREKLLIVGHNYSEMEQREEPEGDNLLRLEVNLSFRIERPCILESLTPLEIAYTLPYIDKLFESVSFWFLTEAFSTAIRANKQQFRIRYTSDRPMLGAQPRLWTLCYRKRKKILLVLSSQNHYDSEYSIVIT